MLSFSVEVMARKLLNGITLDTLQQNPLPSQALATISNPMLLVRFGTFAQPERSFRGCIPDSYWG
jgi:hypothetical protein